MKNKDKDFRNMVDDPFLYNYCCGSAMLGADGSQEAVIEKKKFPWMVVGLVAAGIWAYFKFVK